MKRNKKKIIAFLILNFLLCIPFYFINAAGSESMYMISIFAIMWIPAISSIVIKLFYDKSIKGYGWKPGKLKYILRGYILPVIGGLVVYSFVWIAGLGGLTFENFPGNFVTKILMAATVGVLFSIITAIGEEIGWRGFLVPELFKSYSFTKTSLIVSGIWAIYHFPGIIYGNYNSGVETWYVLIFFTLQIIGLSFITTWLRLKSGSMWPAIILHASHNLFIQRVFDGLTKDFGITKYITTDFGAGLAVFYIIIALLIWKNRHNISLAGTQSGVIFLWMVV